MTPVEWVIVALAIVEFLAVVGMGVAAFLMYRRARAVAEWAQPAAQSAKAIVTRGKATVSETKTSAVTFGRRFQALARSVGRRAKLTGRLAREVARPQASPLTDVADALGGPKALGERLARLHEAGKIAAGQSRSRSGKS